MNRLKHYIILITAVTATCIGMPRTTTAQVANCSSLPWEAQVSYDANHIESSALRDISRATSASMIPLAVAVPVGLYAVGYLAGGEYSTRVYTMESGVQIAATMGTTYLAALVLKHIADKQRPYQAYPGCITAYNSDSDGSWPSGHSAGSAALTISLCLRYPKWYVIAPSVAYTLYMGFSRIHLGMHYVSDVLSGYALGAVVAVGVHALRSELFDITSPLLQPRVSPANQYTPLMGFGIPF
jgi:membrane-associated phospholipid phosphatase